MKKPRRLAAAMLLAAFPLSCAGGGGDEPRRDPAGQEATERAGQAAVEQAAVDETDQAALDEAGQAALERAEEAAQALSRDLLQRLQEEIRNGGPAGAVRVCSEVAQGLAASHSGGGLTVRRVSLRVRNPADRPDPIERESLLELQQLHDEGRLPERITRIVTGREGRELRYLRPIRIVPVCLGCHGPSGSLDPEVARLIAERYPDDEATGYAAGDLRGAVYVVVALD
jgi:hypothetical protein